MSEIEFEFEEWLRRPETDLAGVLRQVVAAVSERLAGVPAKGRGVEALFAPQWIEWPFVPSPKPFEDSDGNPVTLNEVPPHRLPDLVPPPQPLSGADKAAEIARLTPLGYTSYEIADYLGTGAGWVRKTRSRMGLPHGSSAPKNPRNAEVTWTPEMTATLKTMAERGSTQMEMREALGGLSRFQVEVGIKEFGLNAVWAKGRAQKVRESRIGGGRLNGTAKDKPASSPLKKPNAEHQPKPAVATKDAVVSAPPETKPVVSEIQPVAIPKPPKQVVDEKALIAAHLASKGVTTKVDFGVDQPAVDALRSYGYTVTKAAPGKKGPGQWLINGGCRALSDLWGTANRELRVRGLPEIKRGK